MKKLLMFLCVLGIYFFSSQNVKAGIIYKYSGYPTGGAPIEIDWGPQFAVKSGTNTFVWWEGEEYDLKEGYDEQGTLVSTEVVQDIVKGGQNWVAPYVTKITLVSVPVLATDLGTPYCRDTNYYATVVVKVLPVPEPATIILLGTGLAGIVSVRRGKRQLLFS